MKKVEQLIIEEVDRNRENFINILQKVVKIPSYTGLEKEIGNVLFKSMRKFGLKDTRIVEKTPGHPNVLTYIKGNKGGPTYTFNGHLDILPPQENEQWVYPPFSGHIEDGKLYGRGTVDMKAGTFSSFFAGVVINNLNIPLRGNVLFTAVCDEEICGENGMLYLLKEKYVKMNTKDDFGINCEPTNMSEMNIATKGVLRVDIIVKGRGAFGARPYLGISAIDKSVKLINSIIDLNDRITNNKSLRHALLEPASVLTTLIKGGEASNLVPDKCVLTVTRRMLPGETKDSCLEEYNKIIKKIELEDPDFKAEVHPWENFRPPVEISPDIPLVDAFSKAQKLIKGEELKLTGSEGGTDASLVKFYTGMPMPVYGPGDYKLLGTVNEHIQLEDFIDAIKIYALSIYYMLGINE